MSKRFKSFSKKWRGLSRGDRTLVIAAVVAVLAAGLIWLLSMPSFVTDLVLASTRQPRTLTELYFDNPTKLPALITAGNPVTIKYHITNDEGVDTTYPVSVTLVQDGVSQTIQQRTVTLADGQGIAIPLTFMVTNPHVNVEVIVTLPTQGEKIFFRSQS
jgi:hypothetical protein